jgi:hypothetical protein
MRPYARLSSPFALLLAGALLASGAHAATRSRTAVDATGSLVKVDGSIAVIEPDIELSLVTAGGMLEPRREWSETARRLYPAEVHRQLEGRRVVMVPDYDIPDDLDPASRLGQIIRLHPAVATSILQYTTPGNVLATKKDANGRARMDWSLGPGVQVLREQTGADYALFTYLRDSYTSTGRAALRLVGALLLGGDIGGGAQIGVATLVDLRTGKVVWYNLLVKQTGDLRSQEGAATTVRQMLSKLPVE